MKYDSPINIDDIEQLNFKKIIQDVKAQRIKDANERLDSLSELEDILFEELYDSQTREVILKRKQKLQDLKNAKKRFKI